jgi:hypothetical protein
MTRRQQHGIVISLPKDKGDITHAEYRPITLMNTDYKLLARIMTRRLTPVLQEQLTSSQYCSVPDKSILEAMSVLRDVFAHAELTRMPLCILYLDFRIALDCISHHYLFQILAGYGVSAWFIGRIRSLYENATASMQISGALAGPIPIRSAIGARGRSISVLAYADDITVFLSEREDIEKVHHVIRIYERATGAQLNPIKSKVLAVWVGRSRLHIWKLSYSSKSQYLE